MPDIKIQLRGAVKHHQSWWSNVEHVVPAKSREELANMCLQAAEYIELLEKQFREQFEVLHELRLRVAKARETLKEE